MMMPPTKAKAVVGLQPWQHIFAGRGGAIIFFCEQLVPVQLVGRLIGRGGQGIRELREMSRATIKINTDCEPGTEQRKVTVTGTPDQLQFALSLIQQRLAQGP